MNDLGVHSFEATLLQLYRQGAYQAARELIAEHGGHFPERTLNLYFWRACLACLDGMPDQALDALEQAAAEGYWFPAAQLRNDSDLAALQGRPEFERLLDDFERCRAAARAQPAPWPLLGVPDRPPPYPLLIALHTNGGTAEQISDQLRRAVADGWLLLAARSAQVSGPNAYVWNDLDWASAHIQAQYHAVAARYPIDPQRIVVTGFALGGGMALRLALSGELPAGAWVAFDPYVPDLEQLRARIVASQAQRLRGTIVASERYSSSYQMVHRLAELVRAVGCQCELATYPDLGADFPRAFEQQLKGALASML